MRIIGFHGTDAQVVNGVLRHGKTLRPSHSKHAWLGDGFYFWPDDSEKALWWATRQKASQLTQNREYGLPIEITEPTVLGAEIEVNENNILDLTTQENMELLNIEYSVLSKKYEASGGKMVVNYGEFHYLDCQLINATCDRIERSRRLAEPDKATKPIECVRALISVSPFPGSQISTELHEIVAVRDLSCIRKFFAPKPSTGKVAR